MHIHTNNMHIVDISWKNINIYERKMIEKGKEKEKLTRRLKPVTLVKELAIATPESESSSIWPAIITATTCNRYWDTLTTTIGTAMEMSFFSSSIKALLLHFFSKSQLFANSASSIAIPHQLYQFFGQKMCLAPLQAFTCIWGQFTNKKNQ